MLIKDPGYQTTGSPKLDLILRGGYSRGSVVELCGSYSSAKTLLALTATEWTKYALYIDLESGINREYIQDTMELDLSTLLICQPDPSEIIDIIPQFAPVVPLIILDSTAAMVHQNEFISKIKRIVVENQCILLLISQLRNSPSGGTYTSGGSKLKTWCDDRILLTKGKLVKQGYWNLGREIGVSILKSRRGNGCRCTGYDMYSQGWGRELEYVDLLLALGIAERAGSFIKYSETAYKGRIGMADAIRGNLPLLQDVKERIEYGYRSHRNLFKGHYTI